MIATPYGLARRSVGAGALWLFGTSASAPLAVLAGGVVTAFATTGVVAVPLSLAILAGALALFTVGFAALSERVSHAAAFPAMLTLGLGRTAGMAGAAVGLLSYNAIQICLYGFFGATAAGLAGGVWWSWALLAWTLVAALGIRHIGLNAVVVGVLLICEIALIVVLDVVGFTHPADPSPAAWAAPLALDQLFVDGVGTVLAFGVACFIGFESVTAFREEARGPRSVATALLVTIGFLGGFYTISSWALAVAVGPDEVATITPDTPFALLDQYAGPVAAGVGLGLLAVSIVGAMISFHHVVARYLFALGREGAFPAMFNTTTTSASSSRGPGRSSSRSGGRGGSGQAGVPVGGSLLQSGLALATIAVFAISGADPVTVMFTWLATLAALGVMTLMIATSLAVISVHRQPHPARPGVATRLLAPAAAAATLLGLLAVTVANLGTTTGDPAGHARWLLPTLVVVTAAAGAGWAGWLRRHRPWAWLAIGGGQPKPLGVVDDALRGLTL